MSEVRGRFDPAVFIGGGGVGKNILFRIRRMIIENHKKLNYLPAVRFLHVDTDENSAPDGGSNISMKVMGQNLEFKETERCNLSGRITREIELDKNAVKNRQEIKEWFDNTLTLDNNFQRGAGGIRPYGRLAFHYSVDEFRRKLRNCISEVTESSNTQKTAEILGMTSGEQVQIYIVCSLVGGTGSGTFLEVCYNARLAAREVGVSSYLTGIFLISGADLDSRRKANCYSALKELEYHSTRPLVSSTEQHFAVHYPVPDANPVSENNPPVDLCYLVSHSVEGGNLLDRDQMEEAVALSLYMDFGSAISNERRSRRADFTGPQDWRKPDEELKRSRQFVSFGITTLEFPAPRVQEMKAYELTSLILKGWLFEEIRESPGLNRAIKQIEDKFSENTLIRELLTIDSRYIFTTVSTHLSEQEEKIAELIERADMEGVVTTAKDHAETNIFSANFSMDPRHCGEYARQIDAKAHDVQSEFAKLIAEKINEIIENEHQGPEEARAYLEAVSSLLERHKRTFDAQYESLKKRSGTSQEAVYNTGLRRLTDHADTDVDKFATNHHKRRLYGEFLQAYFNSSLKREAYRSALHVIIRLSESMLKKLKEETQNYKDSLQSLSEEQARKGEDIKETIINSPGAKDIGLTPERLEEITTSVVSDPRPYITRSMGQVKDELNRRDNDGEPIERGMIKELVIRRKEEVISILLQICSEVYRGVREISIASELRDKPELRETLARKFRLSKPMIQTREHMSGENVQLHWLATTNPEKDLNLKKVCDEIDSVYAYRGMNDRYLNQLPDPYRIIFASEKGIFPLQRIAVLSEYRRDYRRVKPKHTDIRIDYPDIFPATHEERIRKRSEKAALLGRIFGFLNEKTDPEDGYNKIYLSYFDEKSRTDIHKRVSENQDTVEEKLTEQQIAKEIDNKESGVTLLEKLEELADIKGKIAKTKADREKLGKSLNVYLDMLGKGLEGGDMNSEYQRQRDIVQDFREEYNIPVTGAVKEANTGEITLEEMKYMDYIRQFLREDNTFSDFGRQTLDRMRDRLKIFPERAQELEDEEKKEKGFSPGELEYMEEVRACLEDEQISDEKKTWLNMRKDELEISDKRALELKDIVRNKKVSSEEAEYIEEIKSCFNDGEAISDEQRDWLNRKRDELGIPEKRAAELESKLSEAN